MAMTVVLDNKVAGSAVDGHDSGTGEGSTAAL
jgi:hypothetical protein